MKGACEAPSEQRPIKLKHLRTGESGQGKKNTPMGRTFPVLPYADPTAVDTRPSAVRVDATPALKLAALTIAGLWVAAAESPEAPS